METQLAQEYAPISASDPVIPAVPGEYYSYSSDFSIARPLYCLCKCKANKSRPLADIGQITHEVDLTFVFGKVVWTCSPNSSRSVDLLCDFMSAPYALNQTSIASPCITADEFYELHRRKDAASLVRVCRASAPLRDALVELSAGTILAVTTMSGKYGLFRVKELTPSSIKIDACHILLY